MKIAIQGQAGSFHDAVARRHFGDDCELVCCETFHGVFEALAAATADKAVCAIENSLYGSIGDVYDLLLRYKFPIVGEEIKHIHQQLISAPSAKLSDIQEVYSHPVALNQCREWLETNLPRAELIEHHDTAGAVEYIKQQGSTHAAAIAGTQAAKLYDMHCIARDIEDEKTNLTRFVILDLSGTTPPNADKVSLVLTTSHAPGALYRALGVFNDRHVNLTKLQSRPIRGERFRYQFFIDAECDKPTFTIVTDELMAQGCTLRLLGHYPAAH
ncbi:MAG: prephenate dehydratase [Candidatus Saccharimonadales bacterium]